MANLYYLSDGVAIPLSEKLYERESDLQAIIAKNPHLLLRDADVGKQLFLVGQEFEVMESDASGTTFFLDHLFIDSTGVPVLVEVKRSTDHRIRREVIGQMVDYAARARTWDVEAMQLYMEGVLPDDLPEDFWIRVATNLKAEHFRLVFAADSIPDSLRTLIEFLDRNLTDIEVYGVEISQHKSGDRTILASNIIESVVTREKRMSTRGTSWDAESFNNFLVDTGRGEVIPAVTEIREFAQSIGFDCPFGHGAKYPSFLLKAGGYRQATVSPWKHSDGFMKCLLELDLPDISASTAGRWSLEEVREMLFDLPNPDPYREKRLLRTTPQTVYIDFSVLLDPVNMQALKDALEAIQNSIPEK